MAQYRVGQYQAAVETLARFEKLNARPMDGLHPVDLAFLATGQHQLGRKEQAQATLARLREAMKELRWAKDADSAAFLREAETLIEGKARTRRSDRGDLHRSAGAGPVVTVGDGNQVRGICVVRAKLPADQRHKKWRYRRPVTERSLGSPPFISFRVDKVKVVFQCEKAIYWSL
jgi:hypothetical protein